MNADSEPIGLLDICFCTLLISPVAPTLGKFGKRAFPDTAVLGWEFELVGTAVVWGAAAAALKDLDDLLSASRAGGACV